MEEWQRKYLKTIHCSLEKETLCNDTLLQQLLSDGALADVDLETIRCRLTPLEKAHTLYDIMETRKDGYVAMLKALADCKQSGAYHILLQGYAYCLSRNTRINFLGKTKQLSEYFDDGDILEIVEQAKLKLSEMQINKSYQYPEGTADIITLVTNAEPQLPSFYIPRKLFKRTVINKRLFQAKSSDIFVFRGFQTLSQLEALVYPQPSALSSSFLAQQDTLRTRFILLENENHWERILNITNDPTHLVKYEEGNICVLEMTTGGSKIITQHLERSLVQTEVGSTNKFLSEDAFIDVILDGSETSSGVCICDSPGMGKSFILAKFACKIAERCPDELVAFISLPHFIKQLTSNGIPPQKVDHVYARVAVLEYLSTSPLSFCILDKILRKLNVSIQLLLDGFDEVNFKNIEFTKKLLRELVANLPNTSVIVTSRPNLRYELEATLNVIAFDIAEFTEVNQIEFLVNYWKDKGKKLSSHRLAEFAGYCLESLVGRLTKEEGTITGIPLLCRLLAQVYARKAKRFARSALNTLKDTEDGCQFETSLPKLYVSCMNGSFDKLGRTSESITDVKQYHVWIALKTVFPEFESEYRTEFKTNTSRLIMDSSISMGLLERRLTGRGETVQFIHRTFAEYFVSEFIGKTLKDLHEPEGYSEEFRNKFVRFLLEMVFATKDIGNTDDVEGKIFTNSVVVYFLNYFTEAPYSPLTSQILANHFWASVSPNSLYSMLFGCLRENHENVFQLIKSILSSVDTETLKRIKSEMLPDGDTQLVVWLINVASVSSSISLVDALFALFRDCFAFDLETVCKEIPLHLDTPLHFAIERADVEKIQYFAKIMFLKNRKLLFSLVIRSNDDFPQIVKRKVEMCKLLLSMDEDLLSEATYTLYDSVHVEILKMLIEAGADPRATKSKETVVHFGVKHMSSVDFHELCRFLIENCNASDLFKSYEPKWQGPLPHILYRQKAVTSQIIEMIMSASGFDADERDVLGSTLFLLAVQHGYDEQVVASLAQNGADINAVNLKGQNALHLAAEGTNSKIIPILMKLGVDCRHCDHLGNSFLHAFCIENAPAEGYHDIVSLLSSLGKSDVFHVKNKSNLLPIHMAVAALHVKRETLQIFKSHNVDFNSVDSGNNSILMFAVHGKRNVEFLKTLIEMEVDAMLQRSDGHSFAHFISLVYSEEEYHELMKFLICQGHEAVFAATDNFGRTPLHAAVESKELLEKTLDIIHTKLVKCNKVNINATDNSGKSLLMYAVKGKRSPNFLKALINMGSDVMLQDEDGKTMAHFIPEFCSAEEYHEIMEFLIESGYRHIFQVENKNGFTPLHLAVRELILLPKTLELIKVKLVETGAVNINSTTERGTTILMCSVAGRTPSIHFSRDTPIPRVLWEADETSFLIHRSIGQYGSINVPKRNWSFSRLKLLFEMGADVSLQENVTGNTFVHWIAETYTAKEYHDTLEFLLGTGQEKVFQVENKFKQTPLHYVIYHLEIFEETLNLFSSAIYEAGIVDINSCTANGMSFLVCAAAGTRSVLFLENLMKLGVDIKIQDKDGNTFAHYITAFYTPNEYHEIVELLLRRGQERAFQIVNKNGETPIHRAIYKLDLLDETLNLFNSAIFKINIVDINYCTDSGKSILVCASEGKRSVQFLENLMKMGVDVMIQDKDGNTFAHLIPEFYTPTEYHSIIELLLNRGEKRVFQIVNNRQETPLHRAMYHMELLNETINLFTSALFQTNHVGINTCENNGYSLLVCAAQGRRSVQLLKHLMKMGVDVMIKDKDGHTFAHVIPGFYTPIEYHAIVQILLRRGQVKAFQVRNKQGLTPLHCAMYQLELLNETLELFNSTLFQTQIVPVNSLDGNGISLLGRAAAGKRSVQFLESLIKMGADCMIQDKDANMFAHVISAFYSPNEYHNIVEVLLNRGKERAFKVANKRGQTPLHCAIYRLELLNETLDLFNSTLFQRQIVDINVCDPAGNSLLLYAADRKRSVLFLDNLMKTGIDCRIQNKDGDTFAHAIPRFYTPNEYHEIVKLLLNRGQEGSFKIVNGRGQTPIHCAIHQLELLDETLNLFNSALFQKRIVDINYSTPYGGSFLTCAASGRRSVRVLENLLKIGVNPMIQNILGDTFAHVIQKVYSPAEYHEILVLLIETGQIRALTMENIHGASPIHFAVLKLEVFPETVDLFAAVLMSLNAEIQDAPIKANRPQGLNAVDKNEDSVFHWALRGNRSLELVKHMVNVGADWSVKNKQKISLAHMSAFFGLTEHLKYFVELGCDVYALDVDGNSVLHVAAENASEGYDEIVSFILEKEAAETRKIVHKTDEKDTAVKTSKTSKTDVGVANILSTNGWRSLLELGDDIMTQDEQGNTAVHFVPAYCPPNEYHEMVEHFVMTGQAKVFQIRNKKGQTPLHIAIATLELLEATLELVNNLLRKENAADINATDTAGNSFLLYAVQSRRSVKFLKKIIKLGVDLTIQNQDGNTFAHVIPFHYSAMEYHDIVEFVIDEGKANIFQIRNLHGDFPLHYAVYKLEILPETVDLIASYYLSLENEIPNDQQRDRRPQGLNAVGKNQESVLHWAVRGKRSLELVKHFISLGATWSVKNKHNSGLTHISASFGLIEHLKYFVELGCDVNALDNDGDSALSCAIVDASENVYEMVAFLLESGADKHHKNNANQTAYAYAVEKAITDERILKALK